MHVRARSATHVLLALAAIGGLAGSVPSAQAVVGSGSRAIYVPITPCRLFDTRPAPDNVGGRSTPIGSGETFTLQVRGANGNCDIPAEAVGVAMNTTAVNGTLNSYLTVYPTDAPQPLASSLNWVAGQGPSPNQLNVTLAADGRISLFNNAGNVDVIGDIVGYYEDHNFDDRYYTKDQIDAGFYSKSQIDGGYYTKSQIDTGYYTKSAIDNDVTTKFLSFPAESLNVQPSALLLRAGGLLWDYDETAAAELYVHRPSDYVLNTPVTLRLFYRASTVPPAGTKVQFAARPRDFNAGDTFVDVLTTASNTATLAASNTTFYEATITFPALELNDDWWGIAIQRSQPITNGFTGKVLVLSVELSYTGYTSQG